MARKKTRQDKRRPQKMTDQHDRPWFATVEKESGYPTGQIKPLFQVPHPSLVPPQKYLEIHPDNPGRLRIRYDQWIADLTTAHGVWEAKRLRDGRTMHGSNFDPNAASTHELIAHMGPKPLYVEPVRAMQQGNKWALGLSDVMPKEAHTFFPKPEAESTELVFSDEPVFTDESDEAPANLHGAALAAWKRKNEKAEV